MKTNVIRIIPRTVKFTLLMCFLVSLGHSDESLLEEKEKLAEAEKLAESSEPENRIEAAEILIGYQSQLTPADLVLKLTQDLNIEVRIAAYKALSAVCIADSFNKEEAEAFADSLREIVTEKNVNNILLNETNINEVRLLVAQAGALNSLYVSYPLSSYNNFYIWQQNIYYGIIVILHNRYPQLRRDMLIMLNGLLVPDVLSRALVKIVEDMPQLSANDLGNTISILWGHPVVGNGRGMNDLLKLALRPHIQEIEIKLKNDIDNQGNYVGVYRILSIMQE